MSRPARRDSASLLWPVLPLVSGVRTGAALAPPDDAADNHGARGAAGATGPGAAGHRRLQLRSGMSPERTLCRRALPLQPSVGSGAELLRHGRAPRQGRGPPALRLERVIIVGAVRRLRFDRQQTIALPSLLEPAVAVLLHSTNHRLRRPADTDEFDAGQSVAARLQKLENSD